MAAGPPFTRADPITLFHVSYCSIKMDSWRGTHDVANSHEHKLITAKPSILQNPQTLCFGSAKSTKKLSKTHWEKVFPS